jgi:guanylate kinase
MNRGILLVLAAVSGTGKTTLAKLLVERLPNAQISISHTTRAARQGERDGVDYHFITEAKFEDMIAQGQFIEWAKVHDHHYGTSRTAIIEALGADRDVLFDIDVQGAREIRRQFPLHSTLVFILPPSWPELIRRLRDRQTENKQTIQRRLQTAHSELPVAREFDYLVINDQLEATVEQLSSIIQSERWRKHRMLPHLEQLIAGLRTLDL